MAIKSSSQMSGNRQKKGMSKAEFLKLQAQSLVPIGYKEHKFSRIRSNGGISLPAVVDQGGSFIFSFNLLPDFAEFTTLFDAYCIDRVDITWNLISNSTDKYPTLLVAPDYDDGNAPATINEVTSSESCKVVQFSAEKREHTLSIVPRVAATAYRTGISSAYTWAAQGSLVDMALTDVPFYGVKYWLDNFNATTTPNAAFRVYFKFHVRCVGLR